MRTCTNTRWLMVLLLLAVVCVPANAAINIVNNGWQNPPTIVIFPAGNPPPGVPIGDEEAYARPSISISGGDLKGTYSSSTKCMKITSVGHISISGKTTIYEPDNTTPDLHDHEMGHDKLNRFEFDRNAVKKLKAAMKGFEDMEFCAPTSRAAMAKASAEKNRRFAKAKLALYKQMQILGDLYDSKEYTDHNENASPTPDEAVEDIKNRVTTKRNQKRSARAGSNDKPAAPPAIPPNPAIICSDPAAFKRGQEGAILWDPPQPINPQDIQDALRDILKVMISKMAPVGKKEDHSQHFSDATAIFHNINDANDIYMESAIFQVTLEASDKPGFSHMLHGVLDVWVADINNTVGSAWLTEMEIAAIEDRPCGFWAYFNEPLLDENDQMIADDATVACEIYFAPVDLDPNPGSIQENFDSYPDTVSLQAEWMAINGDVELTTDTAQGAGAMQFNYDTTIGPAEVSHLYPVAQDWLAPGMTHLELWLNTDPNEPDVLENLTVMIYHGSTMHPVDILGGPEDYHVEISDEGYAAVSIPLDALISQGVMLNDIQGIGISIEPDPIEGGALSSFMIDEIRLAEKPADPIPSADLDGDFKVMLPDFIIFAEQWLSGVY